MRKIIFILLLLASFIGAFDNKPLIEVFTNTSCVYCPSENVFVDEYLAENPNLVSVIRYHVYWPSAIDPYYTRNSEDNDARQRFYSIAAVPALLGDGSDIEPEESEIDYLRTLSTPVSIALSYDYDEDIVSAVIRNSEPVSGDNRVFFVLTESNSYFEGIPNNQTMRQIFPSEGGYGIVMMDVGEEVIEQEISFEHVDIQENCEVVCFVQDSESGQVHQSEWVPMSQYGYRVYPLFAAASSRDSEFSGAESIHLQNSRPAEDRYLITAEYISHPDWDYSLSVGGEEFTDSIEISLGSFEGTDITLHYNSNDNMGSVIAYLTVRSRNLPSGMGKDAQIGAFAGASVLVVDDDDGSNYEKYYIDAIARSSFVPYYYPYGDGVPDSEFMSDFEAVVWFTGDRSIETLTSNDERELGLYLASGGNLLMTGQNIGYDIGGGPESDGDPASPSPFYTSHLHATFIANDADADYVFGNDSCTIATDLEFGIHGGSGADNQNSPDVIEARGDAEAVMAYDYEDSESKAGVYYSDDYQMLYLAFGFEGINTIFDRRELMSRILNGFECTRAVKENISRPESKEISMTLFPNPFNSALKIDAENYMIIEIYDNSGNLIEKLEKGQDSWHPDENLPSGIYLINAISHDYNRIVEKALYIK